MHGTCGDLQKCFDVGINSSDHAWRKQFQPYQTLAEELISLATPNMGRRHLRELVGGCPVCVVEGRDALLKSLIDDICCLDHWKVIKEWIDKRKKPPGGSTRLCRKHMAQADEAWLLVRTENYISIPLTGDEINIGHVAFAFKRHSSPADYWPDEAVWICGSSDGTADLNSPLWGAANYWWSAEDHPLEDLHFSDGGYDYAKVLRVNNGHWLEALVEADEQVDRDYVLISNNCADVARKVLTAYGCSLPSLDKPIGNLDPMSALEWWHSCPGEIINLAAERKKRRRR